MGFFPTKFLAKEYFISMRKKIIELKNIEKTFEHHQVLKSIDLTIYENEFLTLLGPSGCGKTTILRIIGGFEEADAGSLIFDGTDIAHVPSYKREINTVFQKYALFPFLNVFDNIAFGLTIKKMSKPEIKEKVLHMLHLVGLDGFEKRKIHQLSGGQQQRVAIARALVNEPKVLLLDEPLGALDARLRKDMQTELKKIQQEVGITFIFVTHDQEEALSMSDTVVVMNGGIIQQIGTPMDIYNEPANRFVADFIGESNIIPAIMKKDFLVSFDEQDFVCVDKDFEPNEPVEVVLRPEDLMLSDPEDGQLQGTVTFSTFKGVHYEYIVKTKFRDYKVHTTHFYEIGTNVGISVIPDNIHVMHTMERSL